MITPEQETLIKKHFEGFPYKSQKSKRKKKAPPAIFKYRFWGPYGALLAIYPFWGPYGALTK